jgi:hypothetical protein
LHWPRAAAVRACIATILHGFTLRTKNKQVRSGHVAYSRGRPLQDRESEGTGTTSNLTFTKHKRQQKFKSPSTREKVDVNVYFIPALFIPYICTILDLITAAPLLPLTTAL